MQYEKNCLMCDAIYQYCNRCSQFDHLPKWMITYHSQECKDVFDILGSWTYGYITKAQAKKKLKELNLEGINFNSTVQAKIDAIMEPVKMRAKSAVKNQDDNNKENNFMNSDN